MVQWRITERDCVCNVVKPITRTHNIRIKIGHGKLDRIEQDRYDEKDTEQDRFWMKMILDKIDIG